MRILCKSVEIRRGESKVFPKNYVGAIKATYKQTEFQINRRVSNIKIKNKILITIQK
jgi:hypothetical protein